MTQQTFWLTTEGAEAIFAHWYPVESSSSPAVVLCHPIGPEYMHCHTALRQLAMQLQAAGTSALTIDLPGYGNSSGQLTDQNIIQQWHHALLAAVTWVAKTSGIKPILLTLRASCLLTSDVISLMDLSGLVWWYPYTRGQAFIRDLNLIDAQLHSQAPENAPCLTGGGYPMNRQVAAEIEKLTLAAHPTQPLNVLIIHTPEQKRIAAVADLEAAGANIQRSSSAGLSAMARQAELSVVPQNDIDQIITWVREQPLANSSLNSTQESIYPPLNEWRGDGFSETSLRANNVFGIITRPINSQSHLPWVVIPNTGAGHHAGPNRLHVDLARRLANHGLTCVRMDLHNLGDSPLTSNELNNEAYNLTGREDLATMISALTALGSPSIILVGLCAGAYNCFQAALAHPDANINSLILINAQTLYWQAGEDSRMPSSAETAMNSAHYNKVSSDPKAWLRLIISPRKWLNVGQYIVSRASKIILQQVQRFIRKGTVLERDLTQLSQRNIVLRFVFSPDEPGIASLAEAGATTLKRMRKEGAVSWDLVTEADHTFTTEYSRQRLIDHLVALLCKGHQSTAAKMPNSNAINQPSKQDT